MGLFGRRDRAPEALEYQSSFAAGATAAKPRRGENLREPAYDVAVMASQPPADHNRPIGSRHPGIDPDSFGSAPEKSGAKRRGIGRRILAFLIFCLTLIAIFGGAYLLLSSTILNGNRVESGTPVQFTVPVGAGASDVADILAAEGIIRSEAVFRARLKFNGDGADFRAGTYVIKAGSSYDTIVEKLERGPKPIPTFDVTVPEGQRIEETAALIDSLREKRAAEGAKALPAFTGTEYLAAVKRAPIPAALQAPKGTTSREGMLFPATYELRYAATADEFVAKQLEAFEDNLAQVDLSRAKKANLTAYEVMTIASLVEREARLDEERGKIAAVIWNRLKIGEPLGIDASNQYDVYKPGSDTFWTTSLKQSDLERDSPFNLRKVAGLPPTPIASPGLASLQAAANPAKVDYRYYVANPDGSGEHFFTEDYNEFLNHPFQGG